MKNRPRSLFVLILGTILLLAVGGYFVSLSLQPVAVQNSLSSRPLPVASLAPTPTAAPQAFDGQRAWEDVRYQVDLGPRLPGSQAHAQVVEWIGAELREAGWEVEVQESVRLGQPVINIVGRRPLGTADGTAATRPVIILGAHYDSRFYADHDPDPEKRTQPVPGANDGASGVAVLLELARTLPAGLPQDVWLVFFDAEDNGRIEGWDWIMGSRAFVEGLEITPEAAIIVDMVGDADLNIHIERNSDPGYVAEIWAVAAELGYSQFIPTPKHAMIDDHTPFLEAGIRAVDIIDFDYPYWHTTHDTLDKVSAESLEAVGETLRQWLILDS